MNKIPDSKLTALTAAQRCAEAASPLLGYLSGCLGKASMVAFLEREARGADMAGLRVHTRLASGWQPIPANRAITLYTPLGDGVEPSVKVSNTRSARPSNREKIISAMGHPAMASSICWPSP